MSKPNYSPAHTIKAYAEAKAYAKAKAPVKVEWKDKTPAQKEKELRRKSEKEAKKRAAAGEWSKEEDDGPVVFEKIAWFNWADEA
jgi:hypothetical protein